MSSTRGIQPLRQVDTSPPIHGLQFGSKEWLEAKSQPYIDQVRNPKKVINTRGIMGLDKNAKTRIKAEKIGKQDHLHSKSVQEEIIEDGHSEKSNLASLEGRNENLPRIILDDQGFDFISSDTPLSSLPDFLLPNYKVNNWGLPGHGESKDDCGGYFRKICLNIDEHPDNLAVFKTMTHRCYDPKCPICWKSWALREADRITHRIESFAHKFNWLGRPIHAMISVPSSLYHLSFNKLKIIARRLLKKVGFLGGSVILHCYRQKCVLCGFHKETFTKKCSNCGSSSFSWYFSPHFHVIGFGWIVGEDVSDTYESSGWVIKNLGVRNSVFGTAFYQLTHCAIWYGSGKKHSVTWIGLLSYNSKYKIPPMPKHSTRCPWCGAKMEIAYREFGYKEPLPCPGIDGFYLASSEGWTTTYALRLEAMIPRDMLIDRIPDLNVHHDLIDQLFVGVI